MTTIALSQLRNDVSLVLRRVQAGERLTVTVAGRPTAQLIPAAPRQWVRSPQLDSIWAGPSPRAMMDDITGMGGDMIDPFAS